MIVISYLIIASLLPLAACLMVIELDETRDHVISSDYGAQLHGGAGEQRLAGQAPVVAGTLDAGSRRKEA